MTLDVGLLTRLRQPPIWLPRGLSMKPAVASRITGYPLFEVSNTHYVAHKYDSLLFAHTSSPLVSRPVCFRSVTTPVHVNVLCGRPWLFCLCAPFWQPATLTGAYHQVIGQAPPSHIFRVCFLPDLGSVCYGFIVVLARSLQVYRCDD